MKLSLSKNKTLLPLYVLATCTGHSALLVAFAFLLRHLIGSLLQCMHAQSPTYMEHFWALDAAGFYNFVLGATACATFPLLARAADYILDWGLDDVAPQRRETTAHPYRTSGEPEEKARKALSKLTEEDREAIYRYGMKLSHEIVSRALGRK